MSFFNGPKPRSIPGLFGSKIEEIPALVNGKKRKAGASGDEATPATKKRNERKAAIEMAKKIANTIKVRLYLGVILKREFLKSRFFKNRELY